MICEQSFVAVLFTASVFLFAHFSGTLASASRDVLERKDVKNKNRGLFDTEPNLFSTVSSEPDCPSRKWYKPWTWFTETKCDRRLELNWINFDTIFLEDGQAQEVEEYVGAFRYDPLSKSSPQPIPPPPDGHRCLIKSRSHAATGYFITTLRYEKSTTNKGDLSPEGLKNPCFLGYWIAYVRTTRQKQNINDSVSDALSSSSLLDTTTEVIKSKCLRLHPFWMAELKEVIGDLPVTALMIPGTHNSGSWEPYKGLLQSEINPVSAYEITQEESIHDQLMHGIRYLDVRVTYHPFLPVKFWISHDTLVPQIPLASLLEDIQRFHEETNGEEIVFVDFHRVTIHSSGASEVNSFDEEAKIHFELIQLIDKYLGQYLVPLNNNSNTSTPASSSLLQYYARLTPNMLWKWSRTIFVTYPEPKIRQQHSALWPPFQHSWANTNNVSFLERYLAEDLLYYGCQGRFWALMTELTATAADVVTKPHLGLRGMAQAVNGKITKWFQRLEWYSRSMAVASDYFLGNNLIEIAIKVNANGGSCAKKNAS